ncbi:MAG: hypothetical protein JNK11_16000 [Alphaproteobacteria bacterium]|nr:hypothetical protein [Alphaproteobacteria bacterium]
MTVSRARVLAVALAAAVTGGLDPVAAQTDAANPPVNLAPQLVPGGGEGDGTGQRRAGPRVPQGVGVGTLTEIDPASIGLLSGPEAFPIDMWRGMSRPLVEALLPRLPIGSRSPTVQNLMSRLLLSAATPPQGEGTSAQLIATRLQLLLAKGELAAAERLAAIIPERLADAAIDLARLDLLLLKGDLDDACGRVTDLMKTRDEIYYQKVAVYCALRRGDMEKAQFGIGLLRDSGDEDATFASAVNASMGVRGVRLEGPIAATPLHLRLLQHAKLPIPAEILQDRRPGMMQLVARIGSADMALRAAAAERAEAAGALSTDSLVALYKAFDFKKPELERAMSIAESDGGARGRALLHRAAEAQEAQPAKATVLQKAWQIARASDTFYSSVRANRGFLASLDPRAELAWFAEDAGRAMFALGDLERGMEWLRLAQREARRGDWAAASAAALWSLGRVAGAKGREVDLTEANIQAWWSKLAPRDKDKAAMRAGLLYAALQGSGDAIPASAWEMLLIAREKSPSAAGANGDLLLPLAAAVSERRFGATVVLCLLLVGEGNLADVSPAGLAVVIQALNAVGLRKEARSLALEALIGAGI